MRNANCQRPALRSITPNGFTLIEMVAVVGIITILAALLLPRWIKRIDLKVHRAEVSNLVTISNALCSQVAHGVAIPSEMTWQATAASWSMLPVSRVTANVRRYQRLYYYEADANPPTGYSQTATGFQTPPTNLRAMVVSILGGDQFTSSNCPNPDGGELTSEQFEHLWALADGERPTGGLWANWKGQGDDFLVQRLNYAPLFHHLILVNREINDLPGFTINGLGPQGVPKPLNADNTGWDAYYLDGTVIGLCNTYGQPMTRYVLQQDISFVWEARKWRAQILGAPESQVLGNDFAQKAQAFLDAARYANKNSGTQQGVVTAMYNFMLAYAYWGNQCPRFDFHDTGSHQQVAEYRVLTWIETLLDEFSVNLVTK
jgi:prepilin-type N-terminal cleavage/methylation domain-containing protein